MKSMQGNNARLYKLKEFKRRVAFCCFASFIDLVFAFETEACKIIRFIACFCVLLQAKKYLAF